MRAISVSQRNRIVSLLKSGETIREVSQKVGLSTATVCRIGKQACSDRKMNKGGRPQALCHMPMKGIARAKSPQGSWITL